MFEFIDILFALLAGVIFTICMLIIGFPMDEWLLNLILIMVIMLVSGVVYKTYIKRYIFGEADKRNDQESLNEIENEIKGNTEKTESEEDENVASNNEKENIK